MALIRIIFTFICFPIDLVNASWLVRLQFNWFINRWQNVISRKEEVKKTVTSNVYRSCGASVEERETISWTGAELHIHTKRKTREKFIDWILWYVWPVNPLVYYFFHFKLGKLIKVNESARTRQNFMVFALRAFLYAIDWTTEKPMN